MASKNHPLDGAGIILPQLIYSENHLIQNKSTVKDEKIKIRKLRKGWKLNSRFLASALKEEIEWESCI